MFEKQLRQEIDKRFNGEELRMLCGNLGLDYDDDLIGQTKDARILSLVQVMQKRGSMAQLIAELAEERPSTDWQSLVTGEENGSQIIRASDQFLILVQQNRAVQIGLGLVLIVLVAGLIFLFTRDNNNPISITPTTESASDPGDEAIRAQATADALQATADYLQAAATQAEEEMARQATDNDSQADQLPENVAQATANALQEEFSALQAEQTAIAEDLAAAQVEATPTPVLPPVPDVIIIEFEGAAARNILMARRIEDSLRQTLATYNLDDINIATQSESINSIADAQKLAEEVGSKVVVWGWVDALGVNIRIYLNDAKQARKFANTNELPLSNLDDAASELAFLARDTIPDNISFISLFIIGQLYYQNNEYIKGFEAFDAATANLPETVVFTNQALLPFFTARHLDYGGSDDYLGIACGYAQAIAVDPEFVPAYVNLAIFLSHHSDVGSEADCLPSSNPAALLDQAVALQPDSALIRYNVLALSWRTGTFYTDEEMAKVQQIIADDPSIPGPHVMLGSIAAMRDEWQVAIDSLETAVTLLPDSAVVYFNLGQLYIITGELDKADSALQQANNLQPNNDETLLALANLRSLQGNLSQASILLDQISPVDESTQVPSPAYVAGLLRSQIVYVNGNPQEAITTLEDLIAAYEAATSNPLTDIFTYYLLGELQTEVGNEAAAVASLATGDYEVAFDVRSEKRTSTLAFLALDLSCQLFELTDLGSHNERWSDDVSQCDTGTHFSGQSPTLAEHIDDIYAALQQFNAYRLQFTPGFPGGMACPFVFTYDDAFQEWQFETSIIYKLVGAESEQAQKRLLTQFDGRLLIQELEPEISYLDQVYIIALNSQGQETVLTHDFAPLQTADNQYHIMHTGDSQLLIFSDFASIKDVAQVWVVAEGYYIRLDQ